VYVRVQVCQLAMVFAGSYYFTSTPPVRYSTSCGERESRPFREEPETFVCILISTPMRLEPFVMHSALPV